MAGHMRAFRRKVAGQSSENTNRIASFLNEPIVEEDPDEWEYDYSTTETETYYVTLDLTVPNAPPKRGKKLPLGRGGSRLKWVNPGTKRATYSEYKYPEKHRRTKIVGPDGDDDEEDVDGDDDVGDEDADDGELEGQSEKDSEEEEPPPPPRIRNRSMFAWDSFSGVFGGDAKDEKSKNQADELDLSSKEVQILDLHTNNPVVSYGGQIYSCEWAENQGTEFIFIKRGANNNLPTLRSLPDNVDLLGAISARIISKPANLQGRLVRTLSPGPGANSRGNDPHLRIPIGYGASARRKDQAFFLEKLIELKEQKGETDYITIHAQKRLMNSQWRAKAKQLRTTERSRLKRFIAQRKRGEAVDEAKNRLKAMDEEDEKRVKENLAQGRRADGQTFALSGRKSKMFGDQPRHRVRRPARAANIAKKNFGFHPGVEDGETASSTRVRWADSEGVGGLDRDDEAGEEDDYFDLGELNEDMDSGDKDGDEDDGDDDNDDDDDDDDIDLEHETPMD